MLSRPHNYWYGAAGVSALLAFLIHELLGAMHIVGRLILTPEAEGAVVLAFNLWNAASALLLAIGIAFVVASYLRRAPLLAGGATLLAALASIVPVIFIGFHQQPILAAVQGVTFAVVALCGLLGLRRDGSTR